MRSSFFWDVTQSRYHLRCVTSQKSEGINVERVSVVGTIEVGCVAEILEDGVSPIFMVQVIKFDQTLNFPSFRLSVESDNVTYKYL
jgi:hypothetical protein